MTIDDDDEVPGWYPEDDQPIREFCARNGMKFLSGDTTPWDVDDVGPSPWPPGTAGAISWPQAQRLRAQILAAIAAGRKTL
jgi:hypothetical protein